MSTPTFQEIAVSQNFQYGFRDTWTKIKNGIPVDVLIFWMEQESPLPPTEEVYHQIRGKYSAIREYENETA